MRTIDDLLPNANGYHLAGLRYLQDANRARMRARIALGEHRCDADDSRCVCRRDFDGELRRVPFRAATANCVLTGGW